MTDRPEPGGLRAAGAALWAGVTGALDLDEHEAVQLLQLCRTADVLDELHAVVEREGVIQESPQGAKAHPALVELRAQRIAFARLVSAMQLPAGISDAPTATAPTVPAETAAAAGDGRPQRRSGVRGVYAINGGRS